MSGKNVEECFTSLATALIHKNPKGKQQKSKQEQQDDDEEEEHTKRLASQQERHGCAFPWFISWMLCPVPAIWGSSS